MALHSIESILNYVRHGFGYSILPYFLVAGHWKKGLSTGQLSHLLPPVTISAYTHSKRIKTKAEEKLPEILFC